LESLQLSASFKSRGIGNLMIRAISAHGPNKPIHFYCSSGGNAGLACATAAQALRRPATIVVPVDTSALMLQKFADLGADTHTHGRHWSEADSFLHAELLAHDPHGVYVPPFDHPDIWEGNATLVEELEAQMRDAGGYDAVVCSVGGGGLFAGVMDGLERYGRLQGSERPVKVLAMETEGADSLAYSLKRRKLSRMSNISSIATSLAASQVAAKAFEWARRPDVTNCVLSDAEAAMASVCFADDERIMTEPACAVSIATAYNGTLASLYPDLSPEEFAKLNIVLVVCGGSKVTLQILEDYRLKYGADETVLRKFHAHKRAADARSANGKGPKKRAATDESNDQPTKKRAAGVDETSDNQPLVKKANVSNVDATTSSVIAV
jgi:L-serine/L-threonine ammonia-lyase